MKTNNGKGTVLPRIMDASMIRNRNQSGFTLIEVGTAVLVFAVGIIGVISLFASAGVLHKGAHNRTVVALAVQQVLAEIDHKIKTGVLRDKQGDLAPVAEGAILGHERFLYQAELSEDGLSGRSMIFARIKLTWREKGKIRGEEFEYIFRPGPGFSESVAGFRRDVRRAE